MGTNNNAYMPFLDIVGSSKIFCLGIVPLKNIGIVNGADRLHAFHYNHVHLKLLNVHVIELPCHGQLCDVLDLYRNGRHIEQCTSIHGICRLGLLFILVQLEVKVVNPKEHESKRFTVKDSTSCSFSLKFLKNRIPMGVTESMINQNRRFVRGFMKNVNGAFSKINHERGVSIIGWNRRGYVKGTFSFTLLFEKDR